MDNKILYLSFHNSIKKIFGVGRLVEKEKIKIKLGRQFLVPKKLRDEAITELEKMGLVEIQDKYIKILEGDFDLENRPNEFFRAIGMF